MIHTFNLKMSYSFYYLELIKNKRAQYAACLLHMDYEAVLLDDEISLVNRTSFHWGWP